MTPPNYDVLSRPDLTIPTLLAVVAFLNVMIYGNITFRLGHQETVRLFVPIWAGQALAIAGVYLWLKTL